ncbi:MAG: glycosyltransferase family 2 protein [Planctomycetes bacterium]|nr:glycosyltransferase family 2 protein [Planctomycetota bacterium]
MSSDRPEISIVIPAYNEETRLPRTLDRLVEYFGGRKGEWELVVVDDGSRDGTAALVERFLAGRPVGRLVRLGANRGKGGALRAGMLAARGRWILFMDADLSTPLEEMERMRPHFADHEVVSASRRIAGSEILEFQPFYRRFMGRCFTLLSNLAMLHKVSDYTCGFKAFRADAAREIFGRGRIDGWGYDVEILFLATRLGYRLKEVPVRWKNDPQTRVRLLRATLGSFLELLQIRLHDLLGHYRKPVDVREVD